MPRAIPSLSDPQMPADQCFAGDRLGVYARKHVPFMSFIGCSKINAATS